MTNNSERKKELTERVKKAYESLGMEFCNLSPSHEQIEFMLQVETLDTLKAMKQQEKDYWDTWKKAKEKEQN